MTTTTNKSFWELLETPAIETSNTADLILWSMNYDIKTGTPYHIFLDLIGYSDENYGENIFKGRVSSVLGYMELDYLGDALKEYATNPQAVNDFIDSLTAAELEGN